MDILASKLYHPPARADFVQRPHILAGLNAGLRGKLTLVSAPAGFGKTTVVSEWIRGCDHPAAWLSLDRQDNDPCRFLVYLVVALQQIDASIGINVRAVLEETQSPHIDHLLPRLVSEIERLPGKSIVVLDDYHLIDSKQVHDIINFLIEYLPATIHLVISGRADPPLPISRLRVQGEVNEVRTSDLRFSRQEVTAYFNDRMGFDLPPDGVAALEARTEGWIASLKLAAISMRGRQDWREFITRFSGSHRFVIDYLVDEVMARQPEQVQVFLRRTSVLDQFCAPLCEYVIGSSRDPDIIEYLDRANLFLVPLDDRREWYRYHHLFGDFLRQRLRETERDTIPELHRRASQWYEKAGGVDEAIQHALAAGDLESATRLVDEIAIDLIVRAEAHKLLRLIDQLPADLRQDYPMLGIGHVWALHFMGQPEMAAQALALLEARQNTAPRVPNPGYVMTVRAYLTTRQGDVLKAIRLSEQALEEMSKAEPDRYTLIFQGSAIIWLGVNHSLLGDLDKASQLLVEAAAINQKAGNFYAAWSSYAQLAQLAVIQGQLHQALDLYQSGLKLAQSWEDTGTRLQRPTISAAVELQLGLGALLYQLNDLSGAEAHLQRSAEIFELSEHWGRVYSYTILACLKQARGEFDASAELYRKACAIEDTSFIGRSDASVRSSLTKLGILLSQADPEQAHLLSEVGRRVEKLGVRADDAVDFTTPGDYGRKLIYSDLANLLIAQERAAEALPLLRRLLEAAIAMERRGDELRYLILMALAQRALGNMQAALESLGQALRLAEPQGYIRLFVDEGRPMAELLRSAIAQQTSVDYANQLLAAFPSKVLSAISIDQGVTVRPQMLVEPLSEREIEVLRLIAEGHKYQEIADRLMISINTVRHHTRSIYGKLGANNRAQAIGRARKLNLL